MAEKPEELETPEDKIARGKELFRSGNRNYSVGAFAEAVDDLSQACTLLAENCGATADDCAIPYMIYAKTLISLNRDTNKVLDVPEEEGEDAEDAEGEEQEGDDDEDEENEEANDDEANAEEENAEATNGEEKVTNGTAEAKPENGVAVAELNGEKTEEDAIATTTNGTSDEAEAQPGTSNAEDEAEEESGLEIAWEVLELAVIIFERQGEPALPNLAEAFTELAGISMENSHFDAAIKDYLRALDVFDKMKEPSLRHIAELHFKIGLCHSFLSEFDPSFVALKKAIELLDMEIESNKAKEQTEDVITEIKDLEETKVEIQEKITEIQEQKQESIEEVKKKLGEFLSRDANAEDSDGPGPSKPDAEKPKPKDISHLIKRKKPDESSADVEASPAKKQALDS